jgi:hypothetical protein
MFGTVLPRAYPDTSIVLERFGERRPSIEARFAAIFGAVDSCYTDLEMSPQYPSLKMFTRFENARAFVRQLGLRNHRQWRKYCTGELPGFGPKPHTIPATPNKTYKEDGWVDWGDWFGTSTVATGLRHFRPFQQARAFVRGLGFRNGKQWTEYCKGQLPGFDRKPEDIPASPEGAYHGQGWDGLGDWLGTGAAARQRHFKPFRNARAFVRRIGLRNIKQWAKYCRGELPGFDPKPKDIPSHPQVKYKDHGWVNWGDWLGTGTVATYRRAYRPFGNARAFVRTLGLRNSQQWAEYCVGELPGFDPKPEDIPSTPDRVYRAQGWAGHGDWLGTGTVASSLRHFRSFKNARAFARTLGIKSRQEWYEYCKSERSGRKRKPNDIPSNPQATYKKDGWVNWRDWLGTSAVACRFRHFRPFQEARVFAQRLGLQNGNEWMRYCKGELAGYTAKPDDIPVTPRLTYKDDGWISIGDWLGTASKRASRPSPVRQRRELGIRETE